MTHTNRVGQPGAIDGESRRSGAGYTSRATDLPVVAEKSRARERWQAEANRRGQRAIWRRLSLRAET